MKAMKGCYIVCLYESQRLVGGILLDRWVVSEFAIRDSNRNQGMSDVYDTLNKALSNTAATHFAWLQQLFPTTLTQTC